MGKMPMPELPERDPGFSLGCATGAWRTGARLVMLKTRGFLYIRMRFCLISSFGKVYSF